MIFDVVRLVLLAGIAIAIIIALRSYLSPRRLTPQDEIDAEARRLIIEHGEGAIEVAKARVERAQWAKGNSLAPERAERILKTVREKLG